MTPVQPKQAASLLLVRDSPLGLQFFMIRRHPGNRFMARAQVFVGGCLDDEDCSSTMLQRCSGLTATQAAQRLGLDDEVLALGLYVSALRECFEESGILIARGSMGTELTTSQIGELARWRGALAQGQKSFSALLAEADLVCPLDQLRYLDHWLTPEVEQRRYDTRFFVGRAPDGQEAVPDKRETDAGGWYRAAEVLEHHRQREMILAPPTLSLLLQLEPLTTVKELLAFCPDRPVPRILPRPFFQADGTVLLLLPDDHRYHDPSSGAGLEHYAMLVEEQWQLVRSASERSC